MSLSHSAKLLQGLQSYSRSQLFHPLKNWTHSLSKKSRTFCQRNCYPIHSLILKFKNPQMIWNRVLLRNKQTSLKQTAQKCLLERSDGSRRRFIVRWDLRFLTGSAGFCCCCCFGFLCLFYFFYLGGGAGGFDRTHEHDESTEYTVLNGITHQY